MQDLEITQETISRTFEKLNFLQLLLAGLDLPNITFQHPEFENTETLDVDQIIIDLMIFVASVENYI